MCVRCPAPPVVRVGRISSARMELVLLVLPPPSSDTVVNLRDAHGEAAAERTHPSSQTCIFLREDAGGDHWKGSLPSKVVHVDTAAFA